MRSSSTGSGSPAASRSSCCSRRRSSRFAGTRAYTRIARVRPWGSGRVGGVHLHHLVAGNVLTLICGMLEIAFQPRDIGVDVLAVGFGIGAAFVLDECALSVHLRDVYWTPEGRHSIEVSIIWTAARPAAPHRRLTLRHPRRNGDAPRDRLRDRGRRDRPLDDHLPERQVDARAAQHLPAARRRRAAYRLARPGSSGPTRSTTTRSASWRGRASIPRRHASRHCETASPTSSAAATTTSDPVGPSA